MKNQLKIKMALQRKKVSFIQWNTKIHIKFIFFISFMSILDTLLEKMFKIKTKELQKIKFYIIQYRTSIKNCLSIIK